MLEIKNLQKSFGEKTIFDSFSYMFENGIYLIMGESGIGKTTLLRMIAGLDTDYSGDINGGGVENVSFLFQEYRLFEHLNALQNVTVIFNKLNDVNKAFAAQTLDLLGIKGEDQLLFPSELSGGMKLRVSIARALCKNAPVLLLDEPSRELNIEYVEGLIEILKEKSKNQIIIIVTHDSTIRKLCDKAKILNI